MPDTQPPAGASTDRSCVEEVWTALREVIDPELRLDVVTLGLVYGVERDGGTVRITYTLTTQGCPMERIISNAIREAVGRCETVTRVDTHLVWDPAWHPGMIEPTALR